MFLLIILLVILLLEKTDRILKDENTYLKDYMSLEYTTQLRGIFALVVMYNHFAVACENDGIFNLFQNYGRYAVGVFFFLSGYGLMLQYQKRGEDYLKGFLRKRLWNSILLPYLCFHIIYYIGYQILHKPITVLDIFRSWINGNPLVSYSWYIIAILFFYVVFWISALIAGKKLWMIAGISFAGSLGWLVLCHALKYGDWWFCTCFSFPLGMIWVLSEEKVCRWLKKEYWMKETMLLIMSIIMWYAARILPEYMGFQGVLYIGCTQLSVMCFSLWVVCLGLKVQFRGRILAFLGKISLELYLIHGLFVRAFSRGGQYYIKNNILFSISVLGVSCLTAWIVHQLLKNLKSRMKGY